MSCPVGQIHERGEQDAGIALGFIVGLGYVGLMVFMLSKIPVRGEEDGQRTVSKEKRR